MTFQRITKAIAVVLSTPAILVLFFLWPAALAFFVDDRGYVDIEEPLLILGALGASITWLALLAVATSVLM